MNLKCQRCRNVLRRGSCVAYRSENSHLHWGAVAPGHLIALLILIASLSGCGTARPNLTPSVKFSRIPRSDDGGTESRAIIQGRVDGARAGQQIVIFARSAGLWWVQPFADQPFTDIRSDQQWQNSIHLGTEYAALLVDGDYHPPQTTARLPEKGGPVIALATAKGEPSQLLVSRTLHFNGYEWEIRGVPSNRGGTTSNYDPANAWTDTDGRLHLRIARGSGEWTCAEVTLTRSLGYGLYSFQVRDVSSLEPAAVLGLFTWDDSMSDFNHRELDTEISRWGDPAGKNAQYVVQPYYIPANVVRFSAPPGRLTYSFNWQPGRVSFKTVRQTGEEIAEHVFTSGVPEPGGEAVHMNLYPFANDKNSLQREAEVVIEKFEYLP
jgi:hypothetical protein